MLPLAFLVLSGLTLAENGKSTYAICVAHDATPPERRAGEEFQRFFEQMTGANLPVVDEVGKWRGPLVAIGPGACVARVKVKVPEERMGAEGYLIESKGQNLAIAGGRPRGTLYGVYGFFDRLGCRWFTAEVSRIPKRPNLQMDEIKAVERPAFEYREVFFTEAFDKDWAARNRTNGASARLDESTGGKVQYYPFVHSFYQLLPPEKYFKEHPEYFSWIDGARRYDRAQLCLTNPDVLRISVERVREWIRDHPEATIFSVSQNDWEGWCECDKCLRVEQEEGGTHSGPLLRFVNAVADEIGKTNPDKLIDTLAYWYTEEPPAKVRPRPNVRIRLCPIGVCEAHPYEKCPRSEYFVKNLRAWGKITDQLYIWHYNTNFSHYLIPFPDFDELGADIPLYHRSGVAGIFQQGAYDPNGGGENAELRSYVMAKLLWNPMLDVDRLVNEFIEGVYGPAAKPMRAYYDRLQKEAHDGLHIWIFNVPQFSSSFRSDAKALLDQAEAAAGGDVALRRRIRKARLPIEYLGLVQDREYEVRDTAYASADLDGLKKRFAEFRAGMTEFGITSLHEGVPVSTDETQWAAYQSHPVVTLENAQVRADIVPSLSGRVVRLYDKETRRQLLARPDPGESYYPNVAGMTAVAYTDYYGRRIEADWVLESSSAAKVVLKGTCANGLVLRRTLELDGRALKTGTTLENSSKDPIEAVLRVQSDLEPGGIDQSMVRFKRVDGGSVEKKLIVPEELPNGSVTWKEGERPDAVWELSGAAVERFDKGQAARTLLSWTAKGRPRVTFVLWSEKKRLGPGEKVALDVVDQAQ